MSPFLLKCRVVRVITATSRFTRTLVVKTNQWANAEASEDASDEDVPVLHAYAVLRDTDVLASADPRLNYELVVEQAVDASPWPLDGRLRKQQMSPPTRGQAVADPSGRALVFNIVRVRAVNIGPTVPVTVKLVYDCLSARSRGVFSQRFTASGIPGKRPVASPTALMTMLANVQEIPIKERLAVLDTLGDCWMPPAYTALTALHAAKPSSLSTLSLAELGGLCTWLDQPAVVSGLREKRLEPGNVALIADCMPLDACPVISELKPIAPHKELAMALGAMRASNSTVGRMPDDVPVPEWAVTLGALVPLDAPGTFTTARYADLRQKVAHALQSRFDRVIATVTPPGHGGPGAARLYADRIPNIARLLVGADAHVWYVAPTPGHAAALEMAGLPCLSVQDVVAGRWPRAGPLAKPDAVCLVYAHGFGLRTWLAVVDTLAPNMLIMAGDRLSWGGEGSPHACDGGAVFRDVCTAIRSDLLPGAIMDRLVSGLDDDDVAWADALYTWPEPSVPEAWVVQGPEAAPAIDLPLVAVRNWRSAQRHWTAYQRLCPKQTVQSPPWWAVGAWLAVGSLGCVAPVSQSGNNVRPDKRLLAATDLLHDGHATGGAWLALRSRQGLVSLGCGEHPIGLDHRSCCQTLAPNTLALELHSDARTLTYGAPVRFLARTSAQKLARTLTVIVPDDDEAVALQDIRAACSLASESVRFITLSGSELPLMQAVERQNGRQRTLLLDVLRAGPALAETRHPPLPPSLPLPGVPVEAPFCIDVLGTMDADTLIAKGRVSVGECRRHMRAWLMDQAEPVTPVEGPAPVVSPLKERSRVRLPRPFTPISGKIMAAMSQWEIDNHVNGRLAALRCVATGDAAGALKDYPPDNAYMETMAITVGGPRRGRHERESAAAHVLATAAKGLPHAETWLLHAEEALFATRLRASGLETNALLTAVASIGTAVPSTIDEMAQLHRSNLTDYMAKWVVEPPEANPIDDEEAPIYAFFDKLLALRATLDGM